MLRKRKKRIDENNIMYTTFYNMGSFLLDEITFKPTKSNQAVFDLTLYNVPTINLSAHRQSLSIRPHLSRVLPLLDDERKKVIFNIWQKTNTFVLQKLGQYNNAFLIINPEKQNIKKHTHTNIISTLTFIYNMNGEEPHSVFTIDGKDHLFPNTPCCCIYFNSETKHSVIQNDHNTYLYFVYDFDKDFAQLPKNSFVDFSL